MNVALRPRTAIELFAGAGGLALGIKRAVPGIRTVAYVEREAYAAAVLVARMEDAGMDLAPVWDDVSTFDGRPFRGRVDLVAGGFPCQDISNAGKRAGIEGERSGLWKEFARIIAEVQPRFVFVENVGALIARGLDVVLGDLAALGFDAEWGCFRASDAGAPHRRERVFILAHAASDGRLARWTESDGRSTPGAGVAVADAERITGGERSLVEEERRRSSEAEQTRLGSRPVANADEAGRCSERISGVLDGERSPHGNDADGRGGEAVDDATFWRTYRALEAMADAERDELRNESGRSGRSDRTGTSVTGNARTAVGNADGRHGDGRVAHEERRSVGRDAAAGSGAGSVEELGDTDLARLERRGGRDRERSDERSAREASPPREWPPGPDDVEGWREVLEVRPDLEPAICRMADGLANRVDRLRLCGNGVVPAEAALAFVYLWNELFSERGTNAERE